MRGPSSRSSFVALALLLGAAGASSWEDGAPVGGPVAERDGFLSHPPTYALSGLPADVFSLLGTPRRIREATQTRSHGGLRAWTSRGGEPPELPWTVPPQPRPGGGLSPSGFGLLGLATSPANAPPRS